MPTLNNNYHYVINDPGQMDNALTIYKDFFG